MARATRREMDGPTGLLARREPFIGNSLSAYPHAGPGVGQLAHSPEMAARYRTDRPHIVYAVFSYRTPIAWVRADGHIVIPDVRYSTVTSRHQGQVRAWLRPWCAAGSHHVDTVKPCTLHADRTAAVA